jgi:hypothetical protein
MPAEARVVWREDRLRREERNQHRDQHQDERHDAEHERLRPEHRQTLGDGGQRGADHPRRVLGGDHHHAEDADRELRDL